MKPGDIMIVFSLGALANTLRPASPEPLGPKTSAGSHPCAGRGTATSKTASARWPDQKRLNRAVRSWLAVRNRWGESVFVFSG